MWVGKILKTLGRPECRQIHFSFVNNSQFRSLINCQGTKSGRIVVFLPLVANGIAVGFGGVPTFLTVHKDIKLCFQLPNLSMKNFTSH